MPPEPILFLKATTAICGPDDDVLIPRDSRKTDWEVELGIEGIGIQQQRVGRA